MPLPKKKVHLRLVGQKGKRASYPEQKKNIMHTVLHATHFQYTKGLKQKSSFYQITHITWRDAIHMESNMFS